MATSIASFMQRMRELGAPPEAIEFAVEQMMTERTRTVEVEAVARAERDALAARRQADADRQWKRRNGGMSRDITECRVTSQDIQDAEPTKESPQTPIETTNTSDPPKGGSVSKASPRRKGSLCPDDFEPSEAHFAKAAKAGRGREFVVSIRDRMHRWSHTNASRAVAKKSDWSLALHDWIDRTLEESGPGSGPGPHGRPPPGRGNGFGQLAAQKRAARQTEDGDGNATEHHADRSVRAAQPRAAGSPENDARGGYGDGPGQVLDLVARRAYG